MGKNVGLTYGEFKFPAEQGFTGSAGVHKVKGYMRGGHVKKTGTANANKGGHMKYGEGGYYGKPGDKYPTLKSGPRGKQGSSMPKNVKAHGGRVGLHKSASRRAVGTTRSAHGGKVSMHDKLKHEGGKMGYAYGGQVKDTSSEFLATRSKQDTMDHGVQPAQTGRNQAEVEAGGNKRLKAGYRKGGVIKGPKEGVRRVRDLQRLRGTLGRQVLKGMKKIKGVMSEGDRAHARRIAAGKNMPKNVKAKGGLAKYAHGGSARKPYTGYNKQAGGSGNEDARYMQAKK
jgi:hypothetical protein